jgi:ferrous iron transport protein A
MMPLTLISAGESATIQRAGGSGKVRQRLADLGLTPGCTVRIMKNDPSSPLLIAINHDSRLALDRALAHAVFVTL